MRVQKEFKIDVEIRMVPVMLLLACVFVMTFCVYMGYAKAYEMERDAAVASLDGAADAVKEADRKVPHDKRITPFNWTVELRGNIQEVVISKDGEVRDVRKSQSKSHALIGSGVFDDVYIIMSK